MKDDLIKLIESKIATTDFGEVAREALNLIRRSSVKSQRLTAEGQRSSSVADIHELRKHIGYYKKGAVLGLDATIAELRRKEVMVRLWTVETDLGLVAAWIVDEQSPPIGLIVMKYRADKGSVD